MEFFTSAHSEVSEQDVKRAIEKASKKLHLRDRRVFFGIDERYMMENCGQYAVYGSEYQIAIAVKIVGDGKTDYRQTLRRRGFPSVVVAHLPFKLIDAQTIRELGDDLLEAALWSLQLGKDESPGNSFGFDLEVDVPPHMIHGILNADAAKDPYNR